MKRVKIMTSHAAHARWLAEVKWAPLGWLARCQVEEIPSPYAYSPSKQILDWNGKAVIQFETSHKRYEVYEVPAEMLRFKTDDEATEWNTRFSRKEAA